MAEKKKTNIIDLEDLFSVMKIFSKNWYIILFFVVLASVLSYFYTYKLPDIYAAKSQILLKSDDTYDYQNQLYKGLGYYEGYQNNPNQVRIITSNDLIRKALSRLNFDVSYFIVGRVKTMEVYESMPFDFNIKLSNSSLYEQDIDFKILNERQFRISYTRGSEELVKTFPFNEDIVDKDFLLKVKKDDMINDKSINSLTKNDYKVRIHNLSSLVYKFKSALSIENLESTSILELTVEDEIPDRAITFLDTLSKVYIDYTAEAQYTVNENTITNIDKQLAGVTDILNSIEDDLENYKSEKSVLDLPRQEEQYFDQYITYDAKKRQTQLWMQSLDALQDYILTIGDSKDDKLLPPSFYIGNNDDYLRTAINEVYTMQMSRNRVLFGATEENKGIQQLDQTMALLKNNILTYIANTKKGLEISIEDIDKQINDYKAIIKGVPNTQRGLLSIQRKVDVNERMYVFLLEKRANTIIARAGILPQTSIIETAHSMGVVAPDKKKILYYFIIVALIISLSIAFVRSVLFATIENIQELKRLTNLPVLGEILQTPEAENNNYLIIDKDPKAPITESFRAIRTNLEYMASDAGSKIILITSYNPGEGKTFCSVNLATILAKAGKKVLLVELDLHKPKVQKALNMTTDVGVSTILVGKTKIEDAAIPTEIPNLSVILSGPTPPNASEIILSRHLQELFDYSRMHYDYIVVDTPPVGLITDALVIMKHVDVSLFVLNAKYAKKQVVAIAQEIVETNKLKNFGFILNGVKRKRSRYYYNYGYGYSYGYGYGYGENAGYGYGNKKKS